MSTSPTVDIGTAFVRATTALRHAQLVTGEMPTYRRVGASGLLYSPSPYMSAIIHDALAPLDPGSPGHDAAALALLSAIQRRSVERTVMQVRARLRRFLAWQEEADGSWCFYGRGSGLGADAATTACAALAVTSGMRRGADHRWRTHVRALTRFKTPAGPYTTFVISRPRGQPGRRGAAQPRPIVDRVVNAYIMRALATAGVDDDPLADYLLDEIERGDREQGSAEAPDPISFAQAAAHAWSAAPRPDADRVTAALVPWLLARQQPDGGFGGVLSTAFAVRALVALGYSGDGLQRAAPFLLGTMSAGGEWTYEPHLAGGHGSASFTTALALSALAACASARGDVR